jgi:hypothetical protein
VPDGGAQGFTQPSRLGNVPLTRSADAAPMHQHPQRVDEDHAAALDILLLLADAGARWKEYDHALNLLDEVEAAAGSLTPEYELKRISWELSADRALAS